MGISQKEVLRSAREHGGYMSYSLKSLKGDI